MTIAERPEIPVVVLTKLDHTAFLALALKNGSCKALQQSGEDPANGIIACEQYRNPLNQVRPHRCF